MCDGIEDCTSYNYKDGKYYAYTSAGYTEITDSDRPEYLHWY